jgi:hypothetical protein
MGHWDRLARVSQRTESMINGWTGHASALTGTHLVNGEALSGAQIIARLKDFQRAHSKVDHYRVLLAYAVKTRDAQLDAEQTFQENLAAVVRSTLGASSPHVRAFGVNPPKPRRALTSEELVIREERRRRTRAARGTMGSRQRLAITTEPQPTVRVIGLEASPPSEEKSQR